jgi:hypothetical protein
MRILRRLRLRRRVRFFFHLARMLRQGAFGMPGADASAEKIKLSERKMSLAAPEYCTRKNLCVL